ncbi:MAG: 4-hydroxy-tetrahydrodipicolinate synthase [Bacteroidales bacterium]|nr:4-hydroxy-tetrahydrodipicolinate synthase [Bacteroidales bacterium]
MIHTEGTGVALVTPFTKEGQVDFESLTSLIDHVICNGVDFLVALGTTSEAATLTAEEKQKVVAHIVRETDRRVPIVLGVGGNNTQAVVDELKNKQFDGIDAILSVAPYYNKPNQEGIFAHFSAIAEASPLPIILYNVPGRTSSNIGAETCLSLARKYKNIIAIKEASGNWSQIMNIVKNKPEGFKVFSGDDGLTLPQLSIGLNGVISVIANVWPDEMSGMVKDALKGNFDDALHLHYKMIDLIDAVFEEGNPAGIKAALQHENVIECANVRLPLVKVSENLKNQIAKLLDA